MAYKTTGKPVGQDMITATPATAPYVLVTNRLDYSKRGEMRHVIATAQPATPGTTAPRFKVIVNASSDTPADIAALFANTAVLGE